MLRIVAISFLTLAVLLTGLAKTAVLCVHEDGFSHVKWSAELTNDGPCHDDHCAKTVTKADPSCLEQSDCTDQLLEIVELPLIPQNGIRDLTGVPHLFAYTIWEYPITWNTQAPTPSGVSARAPPPHLEWLQESLACTNLRI